MKKTFGGAAGRVTLGFVNMTAMAADLPAIALNASLLVVTGTLAARAGLPAAVTLPLMAASLGPVIGLLACATRAGRPGATLREAFLAESASEVPGFCLRHAAACIAWGVPLALLAAEARESVAAASAALATGDLASPATALQFIEATWLVTSVLALAAIGPALGLLVATRARSFAEIASGRMWAWLLKERADDLAAYFTTCVGGLTLFALGLMPLAVLLLPFAHAFSDAAGQLATSLLPVAPLVPAPLFVARLAGAFVAADFALEPGVTAPRRRAVVQEIARPLTREATLNGRTNAGLASVRMQATASRHNDSNTQVDGTREGTGLPLGVAIARAHQRAEDDPAGALAELERLRSEHAHNPAVVAEHARLLLRLGRDDAARRAAADAIRAAIECGAGPIAFDVFMAFAPHAPLLGLDAVTHADLAKILLQRQELDGASWCYRAVSTLGGDLELAQEGVLAVADRALELGQSDKASELFEGFLRSWPESSLRGRAVDGMRAARSVK